MTRSPTYLGVSYSATDYIGHFFGPSSLESEDNILQLDRTLADLFTYVDQEDRAREHTDRAICRPWHSRSSRIFEEHGYSGRLRLAR